MTTPKKGQRIFISYRRADSAGYAGRIYDRLTAHFGVDVVFMDVDTIEAGLDFVEVLQNAVQSCDVLVALIGRRWVDIKDETGQRRLDNPEDFVRIEVAAALSRDIRVIPVLVDGAPMPRSPELPDNLKPLARRNALQVNHHSFNADTRRLISQLELALKAAEDSRILKARKLEEEKARREKEAAENARLEAEESKRKESEERARKEKEAREKAEAEERARLAAEQKARKEREERKRKEAEEKARKTALRKARIQDTAERLKNVLIGWRKTPVLIGGGVMILFFLGYLIIKYVIQPGMVQESAEITVTPDLPSVISTKLPTKIPLSQTYTPKPIATETPEILGIGSTMISEIDRMAMAYVPAGEFQMGSENGARDERPVHTVYLDAFWIDQTEVTNAMYAKCVDAGTCNPPSFTKSYTREDYFGDAEFDNYPVIYVSWNDAEAYCKWAGRRLPSEAEWEKAAGWDEDSHAQRIYPWGNTFDGKIINFCDTNCTIISARTPEYDDGYPDTAPVGNYPAGGSFYGVYDMAGNVFEWVEDWYDVYPGGDKSVSNDFGQSYRVLRGGSWRYFPIILRSTARHRSGPFYTTSDYGFRCALSVKTP